jgi:hypothetical protein
VNTDRRKGATSVAALIVTSRNADNADVLLGVDDISFEDAVAAATPRLGFSGLDRDGVPRNTRLAGDVVEAAITLTLGPRDPRTPWIDRERYGRELLEHRLGEREAAPARSPYGIDDERGAAVDWLVTLVCNGIQQRRAAAIAARELRLVVAA